MIPVFKIPEMERNMNYKDLTLQSSDINPCRVRRVVSSPPFVNNLSTTTNMPTPRCFGQEVDQNVQKAKY